MTDSDVVEVSPERIPTPPPPKIDKSPEQGGQSTESLSVEETNKLRAKLGLKPLQVKNDSKSNRSDGKKKDDLGEFYHRPAANLKDKALQQKIKTKLFEHKEKRHIENKLLRMKPLGDSDSGGDDDDVHKWVDKNRKIQYEKMEAEKRARQLEELDEQFGISEVIQSDVQQKRARQYTDKNLKGLRVEHSIDTFGEEETVVLTLKDQNVLDEGEDVLVNVNMLDEERYKKVSAL